MLSASLSIQFNASSIAYIFIPVLPQGVGFSVGNYLRRGHSNVKIYISFTVNAMMIKEIPAVSSPSSIHWVTHPF